MVHEPKSAESAKLLIPPAPEPPYKYEAKGKRGIFIVKDRILGGRKEKPESEERREEPRQERSEEEYLPRLVGDFDDELPMPKHPHHPPHEARPQHAESDDRTPPLFIKIDKYGDVVKNIQRLKSYSVGLRDALDALTDIEKELSTGLSIANRALDNFNTIISLLDAKLLRIAGVDTSSRREDVPEELDEYLKNVYDQMDKVKHELKSISR